MGNLYRQLLPPAGNMVPAPSQITPPMAKAWGPPRNRTVDNPDIYLNGIAKEIKHKKLYMAPEDGRNLDVAFFEEYEPLVKNVEAKGPRVPTGNRRPLWPEFDAASLPQTKIFSGRGDKEVYLQPVVNVIRALEHAYDRRLRDGRSQAYWAKGAEHWPKICEDLHARQSYAKKTGRFRAELGNVSSFFLYMIRMYFKGEPAPSQEEQASSPNRSSYYSEIVNLLRHPLSFFYTSSPPCIRLLYQAPDSTSAASAGIQPNSKYKITPGETNSQVIYGIWYACLCKCRCPQGFHSRGQLSQERP